jgi:hypothetical protein
MSPAEDALPLRDIPRVLLVSTVRLAAMWFSDPRTTARFERNTFRSLATAWGPVFADESLGMVHRKRRASLYGSQNPPRES